MSAEERLRELGIDLPEPAAPAGSYVPARRHGDLLAISGQIPVTPGEPLPTGRCGVDVTVEEGYALARQCALNGRAAARAALGSSTGSGRLRIAATRLAPFHAAPAVVNGASSSRRGIRRGR